jgi:hypothetical protein
MEPINYTSAFADLPSPNAAMMQGIKDGAGIQALQAQQQQAQLAQQQKMQMNADLAALANNPTTEAIGKMSIKYPALSENFKRSFDILDPAQRQSKLDHAAQVYAALHNGQPDVAQKILKDQAEAYRNVGNEKDAQGSETFAEMIRIHPEMAMTTGGLMLSAAMGPDKFAAAFPALGTAKRAEDEAPADLKKKEAEAKKAKAEADVAAGTVPALIQKPVEENLSAQAKRRIDELEVQIKQANSETDRGRLILERDKLIAEQAKQGTEKGDTAQAQIDSSQHALDTITSLRADPLMKDTKGNWIAGMGTTLGKILGAVPGTENKDFRGQLESLKSQVFLPAVQQVKGMGALSNAEGEKLTAAVAALDADMSPKAFQNALGVVERYMQKGLQKGLASKAVPVQGGGFVMNHPTLGTVKEGDINRIMKKYPGMTRDQVLEVMNARGGQ